MLVGGGWELLGFSYLEVDVWQMPQRTIGKEADAFLGRVNKRRIHFGKRFLQPAAANSVQEIKPD